jgi:D-inositol-3-phosphate glycosyltransferase
MRTAEDQNAMENRSQVEAFWKTSCQPRVGFSRSGTQQVDQLSDRSIVTPEQSGVQLDGNHADRRIRATANSVELCLLTGGDDRPYALGMAATLASRAIRVDFIGSNNLDAPELHATPLIAFLNLRGDQSEDAPFRRKLIRILAYYARLVNYVLQSRPRIFHILWNNKFEYFDRTLLMLYYRLFRKRIVLTAHNVNTRKRDGRDSWLNRFSLGIQYRLCDHILVHTAAMRDELISDFGIAATRVTVIPFGINNTCPSTALGCDEARKRIGLGRNDKVLLFFGQIAPYKGLEYLVSAFCNLAKENPGYRLVIAGKVKKGHTAYWSEIQSSIGATGIRAQVLERIEHIPDHEVEWYFKAANVVVIPYVEIFQSGVPFLSYSFGLPVIATDVGSLRNDIIEGETGFLSRPKDSADLARAIRTYFASDLYEEQEACRKQIQAFANERYSWTRVGEILDQVYRQLLARKSLR